MKYAIAVLLVVLALFSSAVAQMPIAENTVTQSNSQSALMGSDGDIYQRSANWAVVVGDGNDLTQTNIGSAFMDNTTTGLTIDTNASNYGLVIGSGNTASQTNDPSAILVNQMNQLIMIGSFGNAAQSNTAATLTNGTGNIMQDQSNFAVMFGNNTGLNQSNTAFAFNNGTGDIDQTEANVAYVYGDSTVNQFNNLTANSTMNSTGYVSQTAKNLAFAISASVTPVYLPPNSTNISLQPVMDNSTQMPLTPTIPTLPSAPNISIEFPMDP